MTAIEDRERAVLVDLSRAASSAEALRQLEAAVDGMPTRAGVRVDLNTGELLLSSGVLAKMQMVLRRFGIHVGTLYSAVPQTQQTALDEGLLVRRQPAERKRFNPEAFMAQAYKDLDLPFEDLTRKAPLPESASPVTLGSVDVMQALSDLNAPDVAPTAEPAGPSGGVGEAEEAPVSRLSITRDDGSREIIQTQPAVPLQTVYYRQNLRSGQVLEATGNIVLVGDAHSGSEIMADGDIVVWGFLGGIAHAGRSGNESAEIRAIRIQAVQLRIGNQIARRPDRLFKGQQEPDKARGPEVARIRDGEIKIYEDIIER